MAAIQQVRTFNRTVTQRIGALSDEYLARGRPLGASRVLWEIGSEGSDVRALRARLDVDSGYLSRLLRRLERDGLVELWPDPSDKRVRQVGLTAAGRTEWEVLDRRSDDLARSLLRSLDDSQQSRLIAAMDTVERLLTAGLVDISVEAPTSEAALFCIRSYYAELGTRFETGFDPERALPVDPNDLIEPAGLLLVSRLRGEAIGCGGLKLHGDEPAEIKRLWVSRSARGLGVGKRILSELEAQARQRGVKTVHLDTNRNLHEAINLYRSAGYVEVERFNDEPYAHHWFEKQLPA